MSPGIGIGIGIPFRSGGESWSSYWATRNNTVGAIAVTPQTYDTNDGATWKTVGASGADYTSLVDAYAAASAGNVIEIIDDTVNMAAALVCTKGIDVNGKSIKIKGKSTRTTINLLDKDYPLMLTGAGAAIEFENIVFVSARATGTPIFNLKDANSGFIHFINCDFDLVQYISLYSSKESVFDGCSFTGCTQQWVIYNQWHDTLAADARLIINDCTNTNATPRYFVNYANSGTTKKYHSISVTNSTITTLDAYASIRMAAEYENVDIRGNALGNPVHVGLEISGTAIAPYLDYVAETAYVVGNRTCYLYNLWECIQDSTGNAPAIGSEYWKVAELVTGTIENNTIARAVYAASTHGVFLGYGANGISLKNNIATNWYYNFVVKGINNTIEYNCAGIGMIGFTVFANEQASFRNNTARSAVGYALEYGPQAANGTGVIETDFKYNILTSDTAEQIILYDDFIKYTEPTFNNAFLKNIFFGDTVKASFKNTTYDLETQFAEFKTAMGDAEAQFLDPEFSGADATVEGYYLPTNPDVLALKDDLYQAVGAVDFRKYI